MLNLCSGALHQVEHAFETVRQQLGACQSWGTQGLHFAARAPMRVLCVNRPRLSDTSGKRRGRTAASWLSLPCKADGVYTMLVQASFRHLQQLVGGARPDLAHQIERILNVVLHLQKNVHVC
jgi:hypothetical protein